MEWYYYVIALAGAFIAGCINTLAGNGSVITLSILTELMGLPGNLANGTNRVGVLFNGLGGVWGFHRGGKLQLKGHWALLAWVIAGSLVGGGIAMMISNAQFMNIFKALMVVMLVVILVRPSRWLITESMGAVAPRWVLWICYFLLGVYGGLIQMGMGIFFLAVVVLLSRLPMIQANAIKVLAVAIYTALVVVLFHARGMIDWPIGLLMGAGQFAGGWITARTASRYPAANAWAYYILLVIVVLSILSLFGVFRLTF
jgi:uncharacterized membrane protein YfcA